MQIRSSRRGMLTGSAAIAAAAQVGILSSNAAATPANPDLRKIPASARPWARWWWPGTDVDDAVLRTELRAFAAAGFGGVEIQPMLARLPTADEATTARRLRFPQPGFFDHVRAVAIEARRLGMKVDLTFGSGWPFGGPAITPELMQVELVASEQSFAGPGLLRTKLEVPRVQFRSALPSAPPPADIFPDDWADRLTARERIIAVLAVRGNAPVLQPNRMPASGSPIAAPGRLDPNSTIDLTKMMRSDGSLEWDAPAGTWQIFVFKQLPSAQRVHGAYSGTGLVMDHLKRAAFDAYADWIGGPMVSRLGGLIGSTVRAIFCDSLELQPWLYWTDDLPEEFERRRGYDLLPLLPFLRKPGSGQPFAGYQGPPLHDFANGDQVRADYAQTVSELMIERFFTPLTQWAHGHGLQSRVQAHGGPESLIAGYATADIAESENLFDNGRPEFLKMAPSASHIAGHKLVSNESFVWLGGANKTTPEKVKRTADTLIAGGVNQIIYHGIPYPYAGTGDAPWYPFGDDFSDPWRPDTGFWPYLKPLNDYIARLQSVAQRGTPKAQVLVLTGGNNGGVAHEWLLPAPAKSRVPAALIDAGYAFDLIDDATLHRCMIGDGAIRAPGGARYRAVVIEGLPVISAETELHLEAIANSGATVVVVGAFPSVAPLIPGTLKSTIAISGASLVETVSDVPIALSGAHISPDVQFSGQSLPFARWDLDEGQAWLFVNPGEDNARLSAALPARGTAYRISCWDGHREPVAAASDGIVGLDLNLDPLDSALIVVTPSTASIQRGAPIDRHVVPIGTEGWTLRTTSITGATVDLALPELINLADISSLKTFSGRATYRTSFAFAPPAKVIRVLLDLGDARDVAEVTINGFILRPMLLRPYRIDITDHLRGGENLLQITVVNAPNNATLARPQLTGLLSALGLGVGGAVPAGLLGPARLLIETAILSQNLNT